MKTLKEIARRLGVTLIDLLTSKKAIAAGVAALVGLFVKDAAARDHIVQTLMVYIGAQGIVDHAKATTEKKLGLEGAKPVDLSAAPAPLAATPPAPGV